MVKKIKYADNRNWPVYNQKLIKRGEYLINPEFLEVWNMEVKDMNAGKVGEPYLYPNSMIEFLAMFYAKGFSYRELKGIILGLSGLIIFLGSQFFGIELKPEDVIYFEHNTEAVKSAQSLGIISYHYDSDKKDLESLKTFLDNNLA